MRSLEDSEKHLIDADIKQSDKILRLMNSGASRETIKKELELFGYIHEGLAKCRLLQKQR